MVKLFTNGVLVLMLVELNRFSLCSLLRWVAAYPSALSSLSVL